MGLRGPVAKSAEEREYEGGAAHRPLPPRRPAVFVGSLERPKGMSASARKLWDSYVAQAILRPIDAAGLQTICELQADLHQLAREKRKMLRRKKQTLIEFEMTKEARRLEATIASRRGHLKQLCDRYGLNPMSGSRLQSMEGIPMTPQQHSASQESEVEQLVN